jgi:hypothetical protein
MCLCLVDLVDLAEDVNCGTRWQPEAIALSTSGILWLRISFNHTRSTQQLKLYFPREPNGSEEETTTVVSCQLIVLGCGLGSDDGAIARQILYGCAMQPRPRLTEHCIQSCNICRRNNAL